MLRFFLLGALVAFAVLILLWESESVRARVAKGAALAYLSILGFLLFLGLVL